jgi:hypothetical protein
LAFDGMAATYQPKINDKLSSFITLGAFPLDEVESSNKVLTEDKWLYGAQAGFDWKLPNKSSFKLGVAYYDFDGVEGTSNGSSTSGPYDATVPASRQKGNNTFNINSNIIGATAKYALASEFRELNLTGEFDLATFDPVHVILTTDYIKNLGFDRDEIQKRTGQEYEDETDAYQVKLAVGMPSIAKAKDWQVFGAYKYLEADSVVDAFTDSDFNLGGTDTKGWILGGSYGLDKNAWVTARWFSSEEISGNPLSIDVLMLDLNTKF